MARGSGTEHMSVEQFGFVMLGELEANRHKGAWDGETVGWLLRRLKQEVRELTRAIQRDELPVRVSSEAADIANFAMMIHENYARDWDERHEP